VKSAKKPPVATKKMSMADSGPPKITHISGDGSTSYYSGPDTSNSKAGAASSLSPLGYTTPGYEYGRSINGYNWTDRRKIYGGNVLLGKHFDRTMIEREVNVDLFHQKQREQPMKAEPTTVFAVKA
jgi:hypothetical protein